MFTKKDLCKYYQKYVTSKVKFFKLLKYYFEGKCKKSLYLDGIRVARKVSDTTSENIYKDCDFLFEDSKNIVVYEFIFLFYFELLHNENKKVFTLTSDKRKNNSYNYFRTLKF